MILFLLIVASIFFACTFYIFFRLFAFFQIRLNVWFWLIVTLLSFSYILAALWDHYAPSVLSRFFIKAAALWLGVGLLSFFVLLAHDVLRLFVPIPVSYSRWAVPGIIGVLSLYAIVNALRIGVNEIDIAATGTDMTLVQWSDVHVGSVSTRYLERLVRLTNEQNADAVLITGDLMDSYSHVNEASFLPLRELNAPVYWVPGNHERYMGMRRTEEIVASTPILPIRNASVSFKDIQIIGIDDQEDRRHVDYVLPGIAVDPDRFTILLYHRPHGFEAAAEAGVDLMLSGHTHDGQIYPFNLIVRLMFPRIRGLYELNGSLLYVSVGSGTWGPPMRLGSRSRITRIRLHAE